MKTKADQASKHLAEKKAPAIIDAFFEIAFLKNLFRQGWLLRGIASEQCESVAEHTFGVAVLAMFLMDAHFSELDREKVLRMALLHDIGEVYAGDIVPGEGIDPIEKHRLEKEAATQIFGKIPNGQKYLEIWEEYELGKSPESQFVRQIDKLEMALQANIYEHQTGLELSDFYQSAGNSINDLKLTEILNTLQDLRPQEEK